MSFLIIQKMHYLLIILSMSIFSFPCSVCAMFDFSDDPWLNITQLIASRGFASQLHTTNTEDGYILTMHRIINPSTANESVGKSNQKPILMLAGCLTTTKIFLIHSKGFFNSTSGVYEELNGDQRLITNCNPELKDGSSGTKTMAFVLAACGYDVWLGDVRGTGPSLGHLSKTPEESDYWHFSMQEIGMYDFPAMINYVLERNEHDKINIISFSQGTTETMFYLSTRPDLPKPVDQIIMIAPVIFLGNSIVESQLWRTILIPIANFLDDVVINYGGPFSLEPHWLFNIIGYLIQYLDEITTNFGFDFIFSSPNALHNNEATWVSSFEKTSAYIISHFCQMTIKGKFSYHDRGSERNLNIYGQSNPPDIEIQLEKITSSENAPQIALFYGDDDIFGSLKDVDKLKEALKVFDDYYVPIKGWKHYDYIAHEQVDQCVISPTLNLLAGNKRNKRNFL